MGFFFSLWVKFLQHKQGLFCVMQWQRLSLCFAKKRSCQFQQNKVISNPSTPCEHARQDSCFHVALLSTHACVLVSAWVPLQFTSLFCTTVSSSVPGSHLVLPFFSGHFPFLLGTSALLFFVTVLTSSVGASPLWHLATPLVFQSLSRFLWLPPLAVSSG